MTFKILALGTCLSAFGPAKSSPEEPFREVLISSGQGIRLGDRAISSRDLGLPEDVRWSVRKSVLHGGKQEGVDLILIDNGKLKLWVVPTRGMGILRVETESVRLGWDSPVKEVVHPRNMNLQSRGGLGWLEGFNEWLVRCGLEFAGHPGRDKFINNLGEEAEMDLTLHGKIGNIPASEVELVAERVPPYTLRLRGRVDERMFYGPKLELWTELSTDPGSMVFRIEDEITNRGAYEQEFQIIYHANFGPPLLEEGAAFVSAARVVTPFNERAAEGLEDYSRYSGPVAGFVEQVYCLEPYADDAGNTMVLLHNREGDLGISTRFSTAELPYVTLWKNLTAVEEGYVTGLEPGTGFPYNRRIERSFGRVPKLGTGETRRFRLDYEIHSGAGEVAGAVEEIRRIQAERPTLVVEKPPVLE